MAHEEQARKVDEVLAALQRDLEAAQYSARRAQKQFDAADPRLSTSLNNLAALYDAKGKYRDAEPLYRRSLALAEQALGPENPNVATALNNLAELYRTQGRNGEAEPLYVRALAIREKVLGTEHPDVAQSLNNLGVLYDSQGKYEDAEKLYSRALAIREKSADTVGQGQTAAIEDYIIERLKKSYPDLVGKWPPG